MIINSEVWDLHTFKLLRTVPVLDKSHIVFNALGDIMYGIPRQFEHDKFNRNQNPTQNLFVTLDASDYSHIATIDVENRSIYDLCVDVPDSAPSGGFVLAPDNYIAVVENANSVYVDSVVRLYEVGRKKPDALDPDVDDGDFHDQDLLDESELDEDEDEDEDEGGIWDWAFEGKRCSSCYSFQLWTFFPSSLLSFLLCTTSPAPLL